MTSYSRTLVDQALDQYVVLRQRRGQQPQGVQCRTLARIAGVHRNVMSVALQDYRSDQRHYSTRYIVAAEGYGRDARWRILSMPGSDPAVVRDARRTHALWIITDAVRRVMTDNVCELAPALTQSQQDRTISQVTTLVEQQISAALTFAQGMLP